MGQGPGGTHLSGRSLRRCPYDVVTDIVAFGSGHVDVPLLDSHTGLSWRYIPTVGIEQDSAFLSKGSTMSSNCNKRVATESSKRGDRDGALVIPGRRRGPSIPSRAGGPRPLWEATACTATTRRRPRTTRQAAAEAGPRSPRWAECGSGQSPSTRSPRCSAPEFLTPTRGRWSRPLGQIVLGMETGPPPIVRPGRRSPAEHRAPLADPRSVDAVIAVVMMSRLMMTLLTEEYSARVSTGGRRGSQARRGVA